ncbi:MAG: M1 family metallopeptidase [Proteobacteria bacterium]|nr:M1 family metallopeptidase [Pseudomonadota bacterium]
MYMIRVTIWLVALSLSSCLCSDTDRAAGSESAHDGWTGVNIKRPNRTNAKDEQPDESRIQVISHSTDRGADEQSRSAWYDPTPLLASLRPQLISQLPGIAGVERLEDLPLYDLNVDLDVDNRTYMLRETLWFTNLEETPLSEIVLRIYANTVGTRDSGSGGSIRFLGGRCLDGVKCSFISSGPSAIHVRFSEPIMSGSRVRIKMDMLGHLQFIDSSRTNILSQGLEGMATMTTHGAGGDYGLLAVGDGITSLANFYPVLAKRRGDKWIGSDRSTLGDLGSDQIAHVLATIVTSQDTQIVSTGIPLEEPRHKPNGRRELRVGAALVRDFAILSSPDFSFSSQTVNGIEIRSYYLRKEQEVGERVLDTAVHALKYFERRFGAYPYGDFDVVEAPLVGGAGGVEFAGLVTVASMFYRPVNISGGPIANLMKGKVGSAPLQQMLGSMLEFVTAHEVAHQYWHGLVGSDSRQNPFNDEGLAQYSALLYMEDRYGKARAGKEADLQVAMGYRMMRMMGHPDRAVDRPVAEFETPIAYAGSVYGKGPLVYRELRRAVGDATFFSTLRDYVRAYRFRIAPRRAFIDMLAKNNIQVSSIARRWLDEQHGDEDLGTADLSQIMGMFMGPGYSTALESLGLGRLGGSPLSDMQNSPEIQKLLEELNLPIPKGDSPAAVDMQQLEQILNIGLARE